MKVSVENAALAAALAPLGDSEGRSEDGIVFAPAPVGDWAEAEDQLTKAFTLSKEAALVDAPVVYVLDAKAALGRASALNSAVAVGLVAAGRCVAFEGQRRGQYATVVAFDEETDLSSVEEAVRFAVTSKAALGQTIMLGKEHMGAMLP